jgi:hypothetical protein
MVMLAALKLVIPQSVATRTLLTVTIMIPVLKMHVTPYLDVPTPPLIVMMLTLVLSTNVIKIRDVIMMLMYVLRKILVHLFIVVNTKAVSTKKSPVMIIMLVLLTLVILLEIEKTLVPIQKLIVMIAMLVLLMLAAQ